jgi:hypothetical protein
VRVLRKGKYIDTPLNDDGTIYLYKRDKVEFICSECGKETTVFAQSLSSFGYHYNNFPQDIPLTCPPCSRKKTFLEKYGVENISQLEETKEKVRQTNLDRFGAEYPAQSDFIKEKYKQTNLERYGVENYTQTDEFRDKYTETCIEKYGVENVSQLEETKEKVKQTNIEKYGVEYYTQTEEFKNKARKSSLEKFGTEYPTQNKKVIEKRIETNLEKYGVESYTQTDEFRDRYTETCIEKYGVSHPMKMEEIKDSLKQTNLERYGVEYYTQTEEFKEGLKETSLKKFGVSHPAKSETVKNKVKQTNLEKFGVSNSLLAKEVNTKVKNTMLERYGSEHHMRNKTVAERVGDGLKKNFEKVGLRTFLRENNLKLLEKYVGQRKKVGRKKPYRKYRVQCKKCKKKFRTSIRAEGFKKCPVCFPVIASIPEQELFEFVSSLGKNVIRNNRTIIPPLELDIVIPDIKLAIELNGLYWHSFQMGKDENYHLDKTIKTIEAGYFLMHIFEDEWINKRDIAESVIKSRFGIFDRRVFARNCEIRDVNLKDAKKFFEENHLQGYVGSSVRIGLYEKGKDELLSCLALGKSRFNAKYDWEITRFASKINISVVGGFSKLWSYFLKNHEGNIITYSDRRLFDGGVYRNNGFTELEPSVPNYFYFKGNRERWSRVKFQKHKLESLLEDFNSDLTEKENMEKNGYGWIYDCGNWVFIYEKK